MSDRNRESSRHTPRRRRSGERRTRHRDVNVSRDRSRESRHSSRRRDRSSNRDSPRRRRDSSYGRRSSSRHGPLDQILDRLTVLEERLPLSILPTSTPLSHPSMGNQTPPKASAAIETPCASSEAHVTGEVVDSSLHKADVADRIVGALSSFMQVRSKHYYISNFDPNVHDFDVWCAEVDRARELNHWDDRECLGRIGGCLRGDAKTWLNDWVTNDRSWTNFKFEFRSLCPREVDMASVLYDVMSTNSNKFTTYAEYARKSLLRLNIVKGLSDELKTAVVVRGISDPQVKAAAANAKLQSKDLVEFLSVYIKPKYALPVGNNPVRSSSSVNLDPRKRKIMQYDRLTCYTCGKVGHKQTYCTKRSFKSVDHTSNSQATATTSSSNSNVMRSDPRPIKTCTYCKKTGHLVDSCYKKDRVDSKFNTKSATSSVNFCSDSIPDVTT